MGNLNELQAKLSRLEKENLSLRQELRAHQQAKERLKASEERQLSLLEASADPIVVYDVQGYVQYANPAFTQVFGWTCPEIMGRRIPFVPEECKAETKRAINKMLHGHKAVSLDSKRLTKQGELLDIQISSSLFYLSPEKPGGNIVILRDVTEMRRTERELALHRDHLADLVQERTADLRSVNMALRKEVSERRRAENALRESEKQYRLLAEYSADVISTLDHKLYFTYVSTAEERLSGFKPEDKVGRHLSDFLTPHSFRKVQEALALEETSPADVTGNERLHRWELQRRCNDDSLLWVEVTATVLRDEQGRLEGFLGVTRDISQRKLMEESLRLSQERYSLAVSAGSVGVWDLNLDTADMYLDPSLKSMLGFTDDEIKNTFEDWCNHIHPDDREELIESVMAHAKGRIPNFFSEYRMLHKDGSVRWFTSAGSSMSNTKGKVHRLVGTNTDITERKLATDELKRHRTHLEQLVTSRTQELETRNEELLLQAYKLQELNATLKVLLEQREKDKKELEGKITQNTKTLVLPYLDRLCLTNLSTAQSSLLEIALSNLKNLTSSFVTTLASQYANLSPREIQIASLVMEGKENKEIAEMLNLSVRSVETHRHNTRRKLGIKGKKLNLRTYLIKYS